MSQLISPLISLLNQLKLPAIHSIKLFSSISLVLILIDSFLSILIIHNTLSITTEYTCLNHYNCTNISPTDTEIDWIAYMQQIKQINNGQSDYSKIKGDTGHLVYPGGHVIIFNLLFQITNGNVNHAQWLFLVLYISSLSVWLKCLSKSWTFPSIAIPLLILSKRLHSIHLLRLFNDPWAMLFLYLSIYSLQSKNWSWAAIFYSIACSIKMNILLFAPAFIYLNLLGNGLYNSVWNGFIALLIQIYVALPFKSHPWSYLKGSFDFSRKFLWKWTVNWRFLGKEIFESDGLAVSLLTIHVFLVLVFLYKFNKNRVYPQNQKWSEFVLKVMTVIQLIGITFSRSLHYQFYSWYCWTIPYMLFNDANTSWMRIIVNYVVFGVIELCWLTYPSTTLSSLILFVLNLSILIHSYLSSK